MERKKKHKLLRALQVLAVSTLLSGFAPVSADEVSRLDFRMHRAGRVRLVVDGACSFEPLKSSDGVIRLRWPGDDGDEFLGGGGFFVRAWVSSSGKCIVLGPVDFEPGVSPVFEKKYYEGCPGGVRGPMSGADDDSDGLVDEDPLDGVDNDEDGNVDEDFAAIGDEMLVSCSVNGRLKAALSEESYAWSYGHMRDFVGLSTTVNAGKMCGFEDSPSCCVDVALVLDFDIGKPGDATRGDDDEFYVFSVPFGAGERTGKDGMVRFLAVKDGSRREGYVGVIILSAGNAGERGVAVTASVEKGKSGPFSLKPEDGTDAEPGGTSGEGVLRTYRLMSVEELELLEKDSALYETGSFVSERICSGDYEIIYELREVESEEVKLEWALVFGETEELLVRNTLMAVRTYLGVETEDGSRVRWIAPARKARLVRVDVEAASFWLNGRRRPAIALSIPGELKYEDIEWLKLNGVRTEGFEKADSKILIKLGDDELDMGMVTVEGQLTDGTIIQASCEASKLKMDGNVPEDEIYLPDDALQLFPNPFVSNLNIALSLYEATDGVGLSRFDLAGATVSVKIYDVSGRLVRTVYERESFQPGDYSFAWNGLDQNGVKVSPGVYYCKLQIGERTLTKRVILLR